MLGKYPNIKKMENAFFQEHLQVRLLPKLIYWNKSIQSINIIITTYKWIPGATPKNVRQIPKKTKDSYEEKVKFQKSLKWDFDHSECFLESCLDIVTKSP